MGESKRRRNFAKQGDGPSRPFTEQEAHAVVFLQRALSEALDKTAAADATLPEKVVKALHEVMAANAMKNRMERAAIVIAACASVARFELSRVGLINAPASTVNDEVYDLRASALIGFFYDSIGKAAAMQHHVEAGNPSYDVTLGAPEGQA